MQRYESIEVHVIWERTKRLGFLATMVLLVGCGEPAFENAGSQHSLLEDREVCAMEIDKSPAALAYRENPNAYPEYVSQVFEEMNRCIEHKGWKQVRSPQELEQLNQAIKSELAPSSPPASLSDPKTSDALVRAIEDRLVRTSSSPPGGVKKD
jgi:hypothetical protein